MPTITAASILGKARIILQDVTPVRFSNDELLGWLNSGQRDIVIEKPDACVVVASVKLASGTLQSIPAAAVRLIRAVRNMGTTGSAPGRPVKLIGMETLDRANPDWHSAKAADAVKEYMFDELDPRHFYVSPPNTGNGYLEIVTSSSPVDAILNGAISIDDIYETALCDYVLARAYSKDTTAPAAMQKAQAHYALYGAAIGRKVRGDLFSSPNVNASPPVGGAR